MNSPYLTAYIRYSVHRQCPPSGWAIKTRTIPDHELVLIVGGTGQVNIEGHPYTARPGNLFYFYPDLRHSMRSDREHPLEFHALHFSFTYVHYHNNTWELDGPKPRLPVSSYNDITNFMHVAGTMEEINAYWDAPEERNELICNGLFNQLVYKIFRTAPKTHFNYTAREKVQQTIAYIQANIDRKIGMEELAHKAQLSPDYLRTVFKEQTGRSPIQYINKYRIHLAKKVLIEGNSKVKDAAYQLGFEDEFYFSRVFKQYEGISPREYVRKQKKSFE